MAKATYWVMAILLLLTSGGAFNVAMYNWFAADSHNEYSRAYASRGNVFFFVGLALFAAFAWTIVTILRSDKGQRTAKK